jgi:hypothetical protein
VRERAASTAAFSFSGVETSGTGALLHDHANADARERDAASRRESTGLVVDVHRRHREDDGIECLLRELLVDVERRSDGEGHLIAGLHFEVSGDRFRRDLRRADGEHAHLGGSGEGG